jgi:hypothetical protein
MRFSQRIGKVPATKLAQHEQMDDELKNGLWNWLTIFYWDTFEGSTNVYMERGHTVNGSNLEVLIKRIWLFHFKLPIDEIEIYWTNCLKKIRHRFFAAEWYEIYDFMEFVVNDDLEKPKEEGMKKCNELLEAENSAYRFVDGLIAEITSAEEIEEIEHAAVNSELFPGVRAHLASALSLMTDKKTPDYRNSIKESISAVESLARSVATDKAARFGDVLNELEKTKQLHPALKKAFSSLYGYTSDADGIRHALLEESNLSKVDARFMLVCCSAFINYVIDQKAS